MIPSSKKQKFINLALLLTGVFLGVFIVEGMLRIIKPLQLSVAHQPCIYLKNKQFGYQYRPNATGWIYRNFEMDNIVEINSIGFHDIEHNKNNDNETLRIVAIGNSFTAAIHVKISEVWTQILQRELRKMSYRPIDVVNLGLDGTGTDVHLAILKQYLSIFQPDLVILAFYLNDIQDILHKRRFRECYKGYVLFFQSEEQRSQLRAFVDTYGPNSLSSWLFDNFYLFRATTFLYREGVLFRTNFLSPSRIGMRVDDKAVRPAAIINDVFQEFISLSQKHNFKLFVISVPSKNNPTASLDTLRNKVSRSTLAQLDIFDVSPIVQELLIKDNKSYNELFWRYDGHFNTYGNQIFGLAIAEVINGYIRTLPIDR